MFHRTPPEVYKEEPPTADELRDWHIRLAGDGFVLVGFREKEWADALGANNS